MEIRTRVRITSKQAEYVKSMIEKALKRKKGKDIELIITNLSIQVESDGMAFL